MVKLSDAELSRNLELFHSKDRCYCFCGPTLVAINLFKGVEGTFSYDTLQKYHGAPLDANPPHAYAVAERTFQQLWKPGALNQAIVITGESGAGKSFSTNRILDYFSAIGRDMSGPRPPVFREPPIKADTTPTPPW